MRSNADVADALVARQNCTILGIAAALEIHDNKDYPVFDFITVMYNPLSCICSVVLAWLLSIQNGNVSRLR